MNNYRFHTKQLIVLLLVISAIVAVFVSTSGAKEKGNDLQFTANPDRTFNVQSRSVPLEILLSKIKEATHVDIHIDGESKKRLITMDVKNINLIQLLKRIAGDNYAMLHDRQDVSALHVLPPGKAQTTPPTPEFSGKVKVSKNRAQMFFMSPDNSRDSIDDYIKKRHAALKKLAEEKPNKEIEAQMSFQGYLSDKKVIALVKENQLNPVTLNMGWKETGGGHDMQDGESIEDAVKSATLFQEELISTLQERAESKIVNQRQKGASDEQMKSEIAFQKKANELSEVFRNKGLTFYGVRVTASAKQLHTLARSEQTLRLVDPLWGGSVEEEIADVYSVSKIAIPLTPDQETFVP